MQLLIILTALAATARAAYPISIYLYEEENCSGDFGNACLEVDYGYCCGTMNTLHASAEFDSYPQAPPETKIKLYAQQGNEKCGAIITQADRCASSQPYTATSIGAALASA